MEAARAHRAEQKAYGITATEKRTQQEQEQKESGREGKPETEENDPIARFNRAEEEFTQ
jgi:hypothetical protein